MNYQALSPQLNNSNAVTVPVAPCRSNPAQRCVVVQPNAGPAGAVPTVDARGVVLGFLDTGLADRVAALETLLANFSLTTVDELPTVRLSGANLQIVDGTDDTPCFGGNFTSDPFDTYEDCNGLGNPRSRSTSTGFRRALRQRGNGGFPNQTLYSISRRIIRTWSIGRPAPTRAGRRSGGAPGRIAAGGIDADASAGIGAEPRARLVLKLAVPDDHVADAALAAQLHEVVAARLAVDAQRLGSGRRRREGGAGENGEAEEGYRRGRGDGENFHHGTGLSSNSRGCR